MRLSANGEGNVPLLVSCEVPAEEKDHQHLTIKDINSWYEVCKFSRLTDLKGYISLHALTIAKEWGLHLFAITQVGFVKLK